VHLDRFFKKFKPQLITLAKVKVKKGSIEEQQAVCILGLPSEYSLAVRYFGDGVRFTVWDFETEPKTCQKTSRMP
jgi:hypothetical protein